MSEFSVERRKPNAIFSVVEQRKSGDAVEQHPEIPEGSRSAADSIMFSMRDAGWTVERIAPKEVSF